MPEPRIAYDEIISKLVEARALLERLDGLNALSTRDGPTPLGHVVSAISALQRRKGLLAK